MRFLLETYIISTNWKIPKFCLYLTYFIIDVFYSLMLVIKPYLSLLSF